MNLWNIKFKIRMGPRMYLTEKVATVFDLYKDRIEWRQKSNKNPFFDHRELLKYLLKES